MAGVVSRRVAVFAFILSASVTIFLAWVFIRLSPESSPVARGGATPGIYTCLTCHGKNDDVSPEDWSLSCDRQQAGRQRHPDYEGQCEDLLAFFAAARVRNSFTERLSANTPNRLLAGEHLARTFYCFQCHGELGQGGFPNVGALKGYIPGYFGDDFRELTNDASPAAVKAWILEGTSPDLLDRLIEGPIAAFFMGRQAIQMPQLGSLSDSELGLLVDYVIALQALGPMNASTVREYDRLTRAPVSTANEYHSSHDTESKH